MDNFDNGLQEKRRFKRIDINTPLQYKNLRRTSELAKGSLTRNISEGGMCFKSREFISLACRLVVEINLPTVVKPIKAISKVAWIKKLPLSEDYELGNQFLDMSKEDKVHISNFVNGVLSANT